MARVRTVPDRRESSKETGRRTEERKQEKSSEKKHSKNNSHDELKHLKDSLSTFFTPTGGGRRRVAPKKFGEDDEPKEESHEEKTEEPQEMKPLTIDTNCENGDQAPAVSPARRACEKLMDSLSPYFSATSEKRTLRRPSRGDGFFFPGESGTVNNSEESGGASTGSVPKKMKGRKGEDLKKVVGTRKTQNSASAALFGSPARTSSDTDTGSNKGTKKSARLKIPKQEPEDDYPETSPPPPVINMSQRKKRKTTESSNGKEKENVDYSHLFNERGEIQIQEESVARSEKARKDVQVLIDEAIKELVDKDDPRKEPHWPRSIVLGGKQMKTWYSSPFPQEFASNPVLHICEFCLKYKKTTTAIEHHREKCTVRCPPGNEIYRHNKLSIFEVDGNVSSEYCQNLCLIAKLFIDHKTLYYDVEPFLFYIVTINDEYGSNIVGYFSKEKYNNQNWNLSCIVTLPCYQKSGYGRFLIDFSYLLSRKSGLLGTPERPLSGAGRVSYASYWKSAILEWLYANMEKLKKLTLPEIATGTGIALHDVVETLDNLEWFQRGPDGIELAVNWSTVETHHKQTRSDKSRIWLIESSLKWVPVRHSPSKDFPVRSPVRLATPHRSPSTANVGSTPSGVSIAAVGSTIKKGAGPPRSSKKKAARRRLTLMNRKEPPPSSSDFSSSDEGELLKLASKESNGILFNREVSADDSASEKKKSENTGLKGRQTNNSASTSATFSRRTNRGKEVYEDENRSSASSVSSDDDKDTSYSLGGNKGKKGKPQKGKGLPLPRKRRPPTKKPGKSPGKVFPPNYGETVCGDAPLVQRCDSAASSATVPMRLGEPSTPGGGRTIEDVDEYRPIPCDQAPSTSTSTTQCSRSRYQRDHRSTSLSTPPRSPIRSPASDSSISRPHSPLARASRCSTPITDNHVHHQQQLFMNMGGIPDDEETISGGRAVSVESDRPPQLQRVSETSSGEAPPGLPNESHNDTPPLLTAAGSYNSDDDEAPPQLSPVMADTVMEIEPDPDKPPKAPLTEEQRQLAAMDQPPKAPIKHMVDEEVMNSFDTSVQSIMEPSSSTSMIAQTPVNTYPGSLKQNTTPGSVPSCGQMPNHTTPEMQQSFMSPGMQPGSVSSVHGVQPIDQGWAPPAPLSNPATPLRHSAGPFGSPQGAVPGAVQPLRASIDAPTSSKRESSRTKRAQQQQQQAHQLQQQQQFAAVQQSQFPMQMNSLNPMYMQSQYPGTYPTAPGTYGFDPTAYPPGNAFWPNYTPNYGKTNGATGMERTDEGRVFLPQMMPQAAMMYPNYPNGMMQNAYRGVYPGPAAFTNNTQNQFPPTFPLNSIQYHPNQFFGYK